MNLLIAVLLLPAFANLDADVPVPSTNAAPRAHARMAYRTGRFWRIESYRNRLPSAVSAQPAPARTERPRARNRQFGLR